jgi:hypothetical protein
MAEQPKVVNLRDELALPINNLRYDGRSVFRGFDWPFAGWLVRTQPSIWERRDDIPIEK